MNNVCNAPNESPDQRCRNLLATVGDALYVVGGKWTLRIIIALSHGDKRFNALQRTVGGVSARVLSNELKKLELNGFVNRMVYAEARPVRIEYQLTEYCRTLEAVVRSLSEWGAMHRQQRRQIGSCVHAAGALRTGWQ